MSEESEACFQVASETNRENIDKETPLSNTAENDPDSFEKKPEKFFEDQDVSFVSTNGLNKQFLLSEELEEISISEAKNESNPFQSDKDAVLSKEKTLNKLAQESNEVINKEKIGSCINTNEEAIKDANKENKFSIIDDIQNRENKMSNLVEENFDGKTCENDKETVQKEKAESSGEEGTIVQCSEIDVKEEETFQCEKAEISNPNLSKDQEKNKSLSEFEESTTFENIKNLDPTAEGATVYCEEIINKNISKEDETITSKIQNSTATQSEETPIHVKEAATFYHHEKVIENKDVSSDQNEEIIIPQVEESTIAGDKEKSMHLEEACNEDNINSRNISPSQNEKGVAPQAEALTAEYENLEIQVERESVNQIKGNIIKSQEEECKLAEDSEKVLNKKEKLCHSVNESIVNSDKSNCMEIEKIDIGIDINEVKASVQHQNEEIVCEKTETSSNFLDNNRSDKSENIKTSKNEETSTENRNTSSEETLPESKSEEAKEEIQENFKIIDFVDLDLEQNENKQVEQIQSELEPKSLPESISSSKVVQKDLQDNNLGSSKDDLSFPGAETTDIYEQSKEKNDSLQELINSQNNVNISNIDGDQEEEENNSNKSENESTEVMDTEMVNCNEFENVDLNENEMQKEKEIDRIGVESNDVDPKNEEMISDSYEKVDNFNLIGEITESKEGSNAQDEPMLIDDQFDHPGDCENETITGDACNQSSINANDEEDVCIIPDDGTPKVSVLPQNKNKKKEETNENIDSTKSVAKKIKTRTPEAEKVRLRREEKNSEIVEAKTRPLRNAAKLAGNKIKSLVLNDMILDDNSTCNKVIGEGDISVNNQEMHRECAQCKEVKLWKFLMVQGNRNKYLCSEQCSEAFAKASQIEENFSEAETNAGEFSRKCAQCHSQVKINDKSLFWETMDFCNEDCLGKYQTELGSNCANCKGNVAAISLGKYCVRFGSDVKQFCSANCLEEYKKGLKVCSYCQKDISTGTEGFLAPVGDKGQFKDFCTQFCMEKYERMCSSTPQPDVVEECAVCSNSKPVRVEVELDSKTHKLCSEPCFAAFKFVNNITEGQCDMCRKYFDRVKIGNFSVFHDDTLRSFCCKTCMNVYILANRKIVPCNWCKVKKYNFDMIKKVSTTGQLLMMCSLNCLMLYQASVNAVCSRRIKCDFCMSLTQAQYHLTMSDATIRNFCSYTCVMSFQNRYPKQAIDLISGAEQINSPTPTGTPKRVSSLRSQVDSSCVPVISSVQSLAPPNASGISAGRVPIPITDVNMMTQVTPLQQSLTIPTTVEIGSTAVAPMPAPPPQIYQQIITKPPPAKQMKNKSILCKPYSHTKGVSCRPHPCLKDTQTDQSLNRKCLIPIPVPIYVPTPMHMFATPFPVPVPFPLPVPVPIFIPTTRNSAKGIFKEIKKIQEKIPTDPFEAELLMMAEMVAGEKKQDPTDSESEDGNEGDDNGDETFSPENVDTSNTFGDDMLQMALKMASELEEPAVDMESVLTSNTITTSTQPPVDPNKALYDQVNVMSMNRGRKRSVRGGRNSSGGTPSKRGRRTSGSVDVPLLPPPEPVPPPRIEVEKPDANMCLKYTFGVNAWRHWVMQKNAELEKAALTNRKIKLFKPELLQLTADELNFSLCLFVKEVRKPNGTEYAPDTIYYLCLGIQQYLFENGRIDNIFTDTYYEKFTDCLDEVAKKFATLYNDSQYIVTRVEEEHLWESKQLGAHSPHVLLSTLMFFNTKHFNLVTVEEHMQLSFSHIMKHWKRNPNTPGVAKVPGSRNVLLRFYPPQTALEANSRKKKVYEQQENEENPLRCPVKLYEFYLSKCPESVKTRNDVFYLLPERSCVPDSPVWYSTMALGKEPLMKMLHRVKMVKEINIALLTC